MRGCSEQRNVYMRRRRILIPGATYHVTIRANRREFILTAPKVKELYLSVIREAKRRYAFQIENFCIMGNHVHLIIKPVDKENLSRIMQWISSVFAIRYNRANGLSGHVWGERFYSTALCRFAYYLHAFIYISLNPIRAAICGEPADWPYCGAYHYRKRRYDILSPPDDELLIMLPVLLGTRPT